MRYCRLYTNLTITHVPLLNTMTYIISFIHVFIEKVEKNTESMPTHTNDFVLHMIESSPRGNSKFNEAFKFAYIRNDLLTQRGIVWSAFR